LGPFPARPGTPDAIELSGFPRRWNRSVHGVVGAGAFLSQQSPSPIIVKLVETPRDPTGLADVLIGALGLTGALVLMALVLGLLAGGILYFARSRHPLS
jgi:hypothetical protein